jgi:hypothetical protein
MSVGTDARFAGEEGDAIRAPDFQPRNQRRAGGKGVDHLLRRCLRCTGQLLKELHDWSVVSQGMQLRASPVC